MNTLIIAIGLSMDAFAVSVTLGLQKGKRLLREAVLAGLWFGSFQALMPLLGFFLGTRFREQIEAVDHWVAFGILALIGANMLREAWKERGSQEGSDGGQTNGDPAGTDRITEIQETASIHRMLFLAVATSIDALAVGISFALLRVQILPTVLFIGCVTFLFSFGGVYAGHAFGSRLKNKATVLGGILLIGIGLKILLEHLGYISF